MTIGNHNVNEAINVQKMRRSQPVCTAQWAPGGNPRPHSEKLDWRGPDIQPPDIKDQSKRATHIGCRPFLVKMSGCNR